MTFCTAFMVMVLPATRATTSTKDRAASAAAAGNVSRCAAITSVSVSRVSASYLVRALMYAPSNCARRVMRFDSVA